MQWHPGDSRVAQLNQSLVRPEWFRLYPRTGLEMEALVAVANTSHPAALPVPDDLSEPLAA
jgi:hypothetical protein